MRSYANILLGGVLVWSVVLAVGCSREENPPPPLNENLGTRPGEILPPYPPAVNRKILQDPAQFPIPNVPDLPAVTGPAGAEPGATAATPATAYTPEQIQAFLQRMATMPQPPADSIFIPQPEQPEPPPSPEAAEQIRPTIEQLAAGDVAAVEGRLTEQARGLLPAGGLQALWTQGTEGLGAFQQIARIDGRQIDRNGQTFSAAQTLLQFEQGVATVLVALNAEGQVSELYVFPFDLEAVMQAMAQQMGQAGQQGMELQPGASEATPAPVQPAPGAAAPDRGNPGEPVDVYVAPGPLGTGL